MTDSYRERLKHPRWQRRRLERLSTADWKCSRCAAADKPLHVHHKVYRAGAEPWEYSDDELAVLCEDCHDLEHKNSFTREEVILILVQSIEKRDAMWQARLDSAEEDAEIWRLRAREALSETPQARADRWAMVEVIRALGKSH